MDLISACLNSMKSYTVPIGGTTCFTGRSSVPYDKTTYAPPIMKQGGGSERKKDNDMQREGRGDATYGRCSCCQHIQRTCFMSQGTIDHHVLLVLSLSLVSPLLFWRGGARASVGMRVAP